MTVKQRLKQLNDKKIKQGEIAEILNKEGFRTPTGAKWSQTGVSAWCRKWKLGRRQKKKKTRSDKKAVKSNTVKPVKLKLTKLGEKKIADLVHPDAIDKLAMIDLFIQSNIGSSPAKKLQHIQSIINL